MSRGWIVSVLVALTVVAGSVSYAQPPIAVDPYADFRETDDEPWVPPGSTLDDRENARFDSAQEFYEALTAEGRCPEKKMADRGIPCALVVYPGGGAFRPVFKVVGSKTIWTFLDTKLAQATLEDIWDASDLVGASGDPEYYPPTRIVGYTENRVACMARHESCIDETHFTKFLEDTRILTRGCRSAIWSNQADPNDKYLAAQCKVYVPGK